MKIAILETDHPREPLLQQYGDYGQMFVQWLSPALPEAKFTPFKVFQDAPLPQPEEFDGYIITGSRYGAYEDFAWIKRLISHIQATRTLNIPTAGFCFGHQVMAKAYGANVIKSPDGWVLGLEHYSQNPEFEQGKAIFAIHQDQVVTMPEGVKTIYHSKRVHYARLEYTFPALSVQYHPEFYSEFYHNLLSLLRDNKVISTSLADKALADVEKGSDNAFLAEEFATFFRQYYTA